MAKTPRKLPPPRTATPIRGAVRPAPARGRQATVEADDVDDETEDEAPAPARGRRNPPARTPAPAPRGRKATADDDVDVDDDATAPRRGVPRRPAAEPARPARPRKRDIDEIRAEQCAMAAADPDGIAPGATIELPSYADGEHDVYCVIAPEYWAAQKGEKEMWATGLRIRPAAGVRQTPEQIASKLASVLALIDLDSDPADVWAMLTYDVGRMYALREDSGASKRHARRRVA